MEYDQARMGGARSAKWAKEGAGMISEESSPDM